MQHKSKRSIHQSYPLITVLLFWCGLVVLASMYITIPLTAFFTETFHITTAQAAWIGSSFSICYAFGCLLYGPFSDKYGRKIFLVTSMSMLAAVTVVIGLSDSFHTLLVLRGVQGLVAAAFAPISLVYAGEIFPPENRLTAIGFISSGLLMSSVAGQVFSGIVNEYLGWHAIFYLLGGLYFLTALLVVWILPKEQRIKTEEGIFLKFRQMAALLKNPQLLLAFSVTFVLLLSLVGMYTVLGSYLSSPAFGLTSQQILAVRATGIIGMLVSPFAGRFAHKAGRAAVLRGGLALAAIGLIALGISTSLPLLVLMSILFVAGIAVVTPVSISIVSQLGGSSRGSAISFNAFILFLGASAGPLLVVHLVKTQQYFWSLELLGFILLAGFFISCFLKIDSPASAKN